MSNNPSQEAFDVHQLMKLQRSNDNLQIAKNDHQSVVKNVEAKGINLKAASAALKIKKSGKSEEVLEYVLKLAAYLKILGCGFTDDQIDMFAHVESRSPDEDRAYEFGLYSGRMGEGDSVNRYALGSTQSNFFLDGLRVGTEERRAVLDMEMREDVDELIESGDGEYDGDSASELTDEDPFDSSDDNFMSGASKAANTLPA